MTRLRTLVLILMMATAPVLTRAEGTAAEAAPPPASVVPRIAANAAVYGSLYAVALTLVQATSTAIVAVTPPAALGTALTFGIPAVMVVAMANLVPVVVNNVPPAVLDWMGVAPPQPQPAQP